MAVFTIAPWPLNPDSGRYEGDYNGPPVSGGTSEFAFVAPKGLFDGKEITITSDTHIFESPTKLITLGFDNGWMAFAENGSPLVDHSVDTITGSSDIDYEFSLPNANRHVATVDNVKYLRSYLSGTNATLANAGFINSYLGSPLGPGEVVTMYSRARVTLRPEDAHLPLQVKQDRISANKNLEGTVYNSYYVKQDAGKDGGAAITAYEGTGSQGYYFAGGVLSDGHMTDYCNAWEINTPDQFDGDQWHLTAKNGSCVRSRPDFSGFPFNPTGIIKTVSPMQWPAWGDYQDYAGNTAAIDVELLRGDICIQRNGSLFFIGDSANPATCTMFCPLVPSQINNSGSWTFKLYRGRLSDYSNAHIFMLDKKLQLIVGVSLNGG